jgi:hypothetical protein
MPTIYTLLEWQDIRIVREAPKGEFDLAESEGE